MQETWEGHAEVAGTHAVCCADRQVERVLLSGCSERLFTAVQACPCLMSPLLLLQLCLACYMVG